MVFKSHDNINKLKLTFKKLDKKEKTDLISSNFNFLNVLLEEIWNVIRLQVFVKIFRSILVAEQ